MKESRSDLRKVKRQFELWRSERPHRLSAIPDKLWRSAARLCDAYSVGEVRRELGLDHAKLKSKISELNTSLVTPSFVSVDLPDLKIDDPIYELVRPDGAKLRVRMSAGELGRVVASFIGAQP